MKVKTQKRKSVKTRWEYVDTDNRATRSDDGDVTDRLRVPGGWIYRSSLYREGNYDGNDCPDRMAMVFVPDPARGGGR